MKGADVAALAWVRAACASGDALRIRTAAAITLAEMAAACDVAKGSVSRWEHGRRNPTGPPALAYAKLLRSLQKAKAA